MKYIKFQIEQKAHAEIKSKASLAGKTIKHYILDCIVGYGLAEELVKESTPPKGFVHPTHAALQPPGRPALEQVTTTAATCCAMPMDLHASDCPVRKKTIEKMSKVFKEGGHRTNCPCNICKPPKKSKRKS